MFLYKLVVCLIVVVSGKVLIEYVERWKGIIIMNIIIFYEKYINYNLLLLKKEFVKNSMKLDIVSNFFYCLFSCWV